MATPIVTVRVDFPALDALVAYLTGAQQGEVDAMAATVAKATRELSASATALQGAIPNQAKSNRRSK